MVPTTRPGPIGVKNTVPKLTPITNPVPRAAMPTMAADPASWHVNPLGLHASPVDCEVVEVVVVIVVVVEGAGGPIKGAGGPTNCD